MALKNKEDNKKTSNFSNSDFRFEISAKNCINITIRPDSVFIFKLTSKTALCTNKSL